MRYIRNHVLLRHYITKWLITYIVKSLVKFKRVLILNILEDFQQRGLIAQKTAEDVLDAHLQSSQTVYCGFDPTADSLHIGSLVPLLALRRFQLAGHKPLALVGGATGLIGDPSFKAQERQLNTADVVASWVSSLQSQVSRFLDMGTGSCAAEVVNNLDWMQDMSALRFMRDVGKHFSINNMIQKESVKQRIEREGSGISYTEFSYMLLQGYDFAELYKRHGCTIQLGGSDQWGNITAGIELGRRMHQAKLFGVTFPLVTKADGTKFGKTETGTIWLDANKTSPYAFYQFWLNVADEDVYKFLRYFTFLPVSEIVAIELADKQAQGRPQAQGVLATEVTKLVHGDHGLAAAKRITDVLFSGDVQQLSEQDCEQLLQDGISSSQLSRAELEGKTIAQLLVDAGLVKSGKQVKNAFAQKAVQINARQCALEENFQLDTAFNPEQALHKNFYFLKLGKKKWHLFKVV